jgi:hypothetical protein
MHSHIHTHMRARSLFYTQEAPHAHDAHGEPVPMSLPPNLRLVRYIHTVMFLVLSVCYIMMSDVHHHTHIDDGVDFSHHPSSNQRLHLYPQVVPFFSCSSFASSASSFFRSNSLAPDLALLDAMRKSSEEAAEAADSDVDEDDDEPPSSAKENFYREMCATLTRGETQNIDVENITLELQSLKLGHDATVDEFTAAVIVCLNGNVQCSVCSCVDAWLRLNTLGDGVSVCCGRVLLWMIMPMCVLPQRISGWTCM